MARKIVQISSAQVDEKHALVFALADDGSLWKKTVNQSSGVGRAWVLVDDLPQEELARPKGPETE